MQFWHQQFKLLFTVLLIQIILHRIRNTDYLLQILLWMVDYSVVFSSMDHDPINNKQFKVHHLLSKAHITDIFYFRRK